MLLLLSLTCQQLAFPGHKLYEELVKFLDSNGSSLPRTGVLALCAAFLTAAGPALAGEFMLMPTAAIVQGTGRTDDPTLEKRQLFGDLFYSGDFNRLRLLGELQLERDGWDTNLLPPVNPGRWRRRRPRRRGG